MKSIAALAFFAAAVAAQSPDELRGELPECALSCIEAAAEEAGCESGDFACECENQDAITASATTCQLELGEDEKCSASDLQTAMEVADQICEAVESGDESGDDASATESGGDASATDEEDEPTETGEEDPAESGDDSADDSGDNNTGGDSEGGDSDDQDAEGDEDGAAMKLNGYGWAGAAAAAVALIF